MRHVRRISKRPALSQQIPLSAVIQFVIAVLDAFAPVLTAMKADDDWY